MANRRMFSRVITNSDTFLNLPMSTQLLYFHLGMNADDDGFVQLKSNMRTIGAGEDDAKLLIERSLLILFNGGIVVIRDWLVHNEIRQDRYKPTFYLEEKKLLSTNENKQYICNNLLVLPNDNRLDTQVRLGKVRLGKNKREKASSNTKPSTKKEVDLVPYRNTDTYLNAENKRLAIEKYNLATKTNNRTPEYLRDITGSELILLSIETGIDPNDLKKFALDLYTRYSSGKRKNGEPILDFKRFLVHIIRADQVRLRASYGSVESWNGI